MPEIELIGGEKLQEFIDDVKNARLGDIEVGFFKTAKYPDGTSVAQVAATHEFGAPTVPQRPFFRQAIRKMERPAQLPRIVRKLVDRRTMTMPRVGYERIGQYAANQIQERIVLLRKPPNSPETIRRKGSSNPLIDVGAMRTAVSWRVKWRG